MRGRRIIWLFVSNFKYFEIIWAKQRLPLDLSVHRSTISSPKTKCPEQEFHVDNLIPGDSKGMLECCKLWSRCARGRARALSSVSTHCPPSVFSSFHSGTSLKRPCKIQFEFKQTQKRRRFYHLCLESSHLGSKVILIAPRGLNISIIYNSTSNSCFYTFHDS